MMSDKKSSPKVIIEEINRKNREYEVLKSRYNSLMNEMNQKLVHDSSQIYHDNENM